MPSTRWRQTPYPSPSKNELAPFLTSVDDWRGFCDAVSEAHQQTSSHRQRYGELYARMLEMLDSKWYKEMPDDVDPWDVNWVSEDTHRYVESRFLQRSIRRIMKDNTKISNSFNIVDGVVTVTKEQKDAFDRNMGDMLPLVKRLREVLSATVML